MHLSNFFSLLSASTVLMTVQCHMEMSYPAPFRSRFNPHIAPGSGDYSMTSPLKSDGSDFPCKGYHKDMKDITGAGAPVTKWNAGSAYNFTIVGGATHNGGSCQAALSYDNGATFKVIHSYIGDCPIMNTGNFDLSVPSDAKSGNAIFAWAWLNEIGNREYYMNCASVRIDGDSTGKPSPKVPFSSRPDLFVANLGNGCTTVEGKDTIYPDPGPDVTNKSTAPNNGNTFVGNCGPMKSSDDSIPGSDSSPALVARRSNLIDKSFVPTHVLNDPSITTVTASASGSGSPFLVTTSSVNGECGGSQSCPGSGFGGCCSKYGYCGDTMSHCGEGCMGSFGVCGMNATVLRLRMRRPHFRF